MSVMLLLVGLPLLLAAFFGIFAFKGVRPMVYRCLRCEAEFRRPAARGFPESCPRCGAHDWNVAA